MRTRVPSNLRAPVVVGWMLAWLLLLAACIWLNGEWGAIRAHNAVWALVAGFALNALFCAAILWLRPVRQCVLCPGGRIERIRRDLLVTLVFSALVAAALLQDLASRAV